MAAVTQVQILVTTLASFCISQPPPLVPPQALPFDFHDDLFPYFYLIKGKKLPLRIFCSNFIENFLSFFFSFLLFLLVYLFVFTFLFFSFLFFFQLIRTSKRKMLLDREQQNFAN